KKKGNFRFEPRLAAFLLRRGREPALVDLGPEAPIARAVAAWRLAAAGERSPDQEGRDLARLIWQPLAQHLKGARAVLIAPDGVLCGLPFAALPGRQEGTYLVEDLAIGHVTSGRHLLELAADRDAPRGQGLLAVGDLAFGKPSGKPPAFARLAYEPLPG